jgi:hypothetical protein
MNTIVFVMMVFTHSVNWVPTIEFKSLELCERAANVIKTQTDPKLTWGEMRQPFCIRIEK